MTDAIYPYHMGGKEVRYHHVVAGLVAQGIEVHLFTMNWWKGPPHKVEDGVHYHALCRQYPLYNETKRSIFEAIMFSIACLRLLSYRFDLIEADHMPHLQLFTIWMVALVRRVPLVVTWHEYWGREYWSQYLGRLGPIAAFIEQRSMRLADRLITPSPETAVRLVEQGIAERSVSVVPNGLDLEAIEAAIASPDRYDLLCVGRLIAHKHVDAVIDAIAALRGRGVALSCAIVGEGPERARLGAAVADHELGREVTFLGNLDDQTEIFSLMKSARLFVLPSTREGFGIVVAEAMACGLPVITTDHPDNHSRTLVEAGVSGWLCEATGPSLAAAVELGLSTELSKPLIERSALEKLGWPGSVARIVEIFASSRRPLRDLEQ